MTCSNCRRDTIGAKCYWCGADVTPPVKPVHVLDKSKPFVTVQAGQFQPMELECTFHGRNGFRVMWDEHGGRTAKVEVKNKKGEWEPLSGVQKINISLDVDERLPRVNIERVIIPEKIMRYEYECPNKECETTDFVADKPLSKYKEPADCPECGIESPKVMKTPVPKSQSWSA